MKRISFFFLIILIIPAYIFPQWSNNPNQNLQISDFGYWVTACEDGMGGAFVGWTTANTDYPSSWLQWVDKYGYVRWSQPLHIVGNGETQAGLKLVKAETGKVIILFTDGIQVGWDSLVWQPIFHPYLRANKIDTTGLLYWGENGMTVIEDTAVTYGGYEIVEDEENGAYLTWINVYPPYYTSSEDSAISRVQKLSKDGERLWGENGKFISTWYAGENFPVPYLSRRKPDGIFLRYQKQNIGNVLESINPDMTVRWSKVSEWYGNIIPDENGGGAWARKVVIPFTASYKIAANRIDSLGNLLWNDSSLTVENDIGLYSFLGTISFITDSILSITWTKSFYPSNSSTNAKFQNIRNDGSFIFESGSINISENPDSTSIGTIVDDLYLWRDYKEAFQKLICSKLDSYGVELWQTIITNSEMEHGAIISDGNFGAIIVYSKYFSPNSGVFIQKVSKNGILGEVITGLNDEIGIVDLNFKLYQNYPNPFNPTTKIKYSIPQTTHPLPGGERGGSVTLKVYDILGNEVATLINETKPAGAYEVEFNAEGLSSGVYFYQLSSGSFISTKKLLLLK